MINDNNLNKREHYKCSLLLYTVNYKNLDLKKCKKFDILEYMEFNLIDEF